MEGYLPDKDAFQMFLGKIIQDVMPDQTDNYNFESQELIDDIYAGRDIRKSKKSGKADLGLGHDGVKMVLEMIPLIWSTFKTFKEIWETTHPSVPTQEKLKDQWAKT